MKKERGKPQHFHGLALTTHEWFRFVRKKNGFLFITILIQSNQAVTLIANYSLMIRMPLFMVKKPLES